MWNPFQPERPKENLNYRTHIDKPTSTYDVYDPKNRLAQVRLYNFACMDMFPQQVAIEDVHAFLFFDHPQVTKRQMGRTILQALTYDPRKLKGVSKDHPKACMTYVIPDPVELRYGLEWMLSMWLWRTDERVTGNQEANREVMLKIFAELGAQEGDTPAFWADVAWDKEPWYFVENAEGVKIVNRKPAPIVWADLWRKFEWTEEMKKADWIPQKPQYLKDLSKK